MLNERGYERETNCSGMLRTSFKLQRAQHVHQACRKLCEHVRLLQWYIPIFFLTSTKETYDMLLPED